MPCSASGWPAPRHLDFDGHRRNLGDRKPGDSVPDDTDHDKRAAGVVPGGDLGSRLLAVKLLLDNLARGLHQIAAARDDAPQAMLPLVEAEAGRARSMLAAIIAELNPSGAGDMALDGSLQRLMVMAGPVLARDLVERLLDDLAAVATALRRARAGDWALLRAQSHILIALAGAAGAPQLQRAAEELNRIAQGAEAAALAGALPPCLTMIAALRDKIQTLPLPADPLPEPRDAAR
jgi:hypothetical protein